MDLPLHEVAFLKGVRVGEFNNSRNISWGSGSHIDISPDDERSFAMHTWYMDCLIYICNTSIN